MKHILFTKELLLLVVAVFVMIATSCIKEDLDQCYYAQTEGREYQGRRYNGIRMDGIYRSVYIRRESELLGET